MSDGTLEHNKHQTADSSATSEKRETSRKSAIGGLNPELKSALTKALGSWETLTEQVSTKKSPDEEQLEEVKRLLNELKSKINEFND